MKNSRIVIDLLNNNETFIANDCRHRSCDICDNSVKCQLVELHHKDHNNNNNVRSNVQWLCWFCHHHGWHGDPFYDFEMLWGWYSNLDDIHYLFAKDRNKKNKRILNRTGQDFVDLMTAPIDKYEKWLRLAIQSEIAVWSYKFSQTNTHILLERFPCCSDLSIMKKISIEALIEANTIKVKI